ncbi:putative MutT/nudix family protein, partial [Salipiger bermudensis HTCC2601]
PASASPKSHPCDVALFHQRCRCTEIIAVFDVSFSEGAFEGRDSIEFREAHGGACIARWFDLDDLDLDGGAELYPSGLKNHLLRKGS